MRITEAQGYKTVCQTKTSHGVRIEVECAWLQSPTPPRCTTMLPRTVKAKHGEKSACAQSYPLLCDPVDCSLPGSSVHGTLQAGILEWGATPSSRGASRPRDWARVSCISCSAGGCFVAEPLEKSCHGSVKVRSHIIWSFKYLRKFQMIFPPKSRNWISVLLWYFSREDLKDLV